MRSDQNAIGRILDPELRYSEGANISDITDVHKTLANSFMSHL